MFDSITVAKLSVITTESVNKPDCLPSGVASETETRLGCFARDKLLLTIASTTCGNFVCSLSRCTTSAGRDFAVCKFEFGNSTRTTSPRLRFGIEGGFVAVIIVVSVHFRAFPIFRKRA